MFGYVTVDKPSMRVREYDYYRAAYCGLCHSMGKCTGCLSRMTLSYDMVFFALMREAITCSPASFKKKRCIRHPLVARPVMKADGELEYAAAVAGLLASKKIDDNVNDEKGIKRFAARVTRLIFRKMRKRSRRFSAELSDFLSDRLSELDRMERERVRSVDMPADVFGEIMAGLLSFGLENEKKKIAENIGLRVGRWVYMADALDDYEDDRKSGSYNPFVELYGGEDFSEDNLLSITYMLEGELAMADAAFDLLDTDGDVSRREILKNILCLGMPQSVKKILYGKNGDKKNEGSL